MYKKQRSIEKTTNDILANNKLEEKNNQNLFIECVGSIYPTLKFKVVNFGTKYSIYDKEFEDLNQDYSGDKDKLIKECCYEKEFTENTDIEPIWIDGNKLIIYANWKLGITDEIILLILLFQIDILIIKDSLFDEPVYRIPERILSLKIYSYNFDQPIEDLPINLKILCLKHCSNAEYNFFGKSTDDSEWIDFNQPVDSLPDSLEELVIVSSIFDKPIDSLPSGLKKLYICSEGLDKFNQSVDNLPSGLETLVIQSQRFKQKLNNLPDSIKLIYIPFHTGHPDVLDNLPNSLDTLYYGIWDGEVEFKKMYSVDNLPSNIKYLHLGASFNNSIDNLPNSITHLTIGGEANGTTGFNTMINKLPQNLSYIRIYSFSYNDSLNNIKKLFSNLNFELIDKKFNFTKVFQELGFCFEEKLFDWDKIGYATDCDI